MICEVHKVSSAVGIGRFLLPTIVWRKVVYGIGSRDREIPPTEIALAKSVTDWFVGLDLSIQTERAWDVSPGEAVSDEYLGKEPLRGGFPEYVWQVRRSGSGDPSYRDCACQICDRLVYRSGFVNPDGAGRGCVAGRNRKQYLGKELLRLTPYVNSGKIIYGVGSLCVRQRMMYSASVNFAQLCTEGL